MAKPRHRAPSPNTPRWLSWMLTAFAVPLALTTTGALLLTSGLEQDLARRATAAAGHAGFRTVTVDMVGRDATVHGTPPGGHGRARMIVQNVDGVRAATLPESFDRLAPLVLTSERGHLSVSAALGSERERDEVLTALRHAVPGTTVADGLGIVAGQHAPLPVEQLAAVARSIAVDAGNITLSWQPHRLIVAGSPAGKAQADRVRNALRDVVPGAVIDDRMTPGEAP